MIEIAAVGGYSEVGKNMTAIKVDNEVIICDMGLHLEPYIQYTDEEDFDKILSAKELLKVGAIPDDSVIENWKREVKAIIPTHGHLDHVGALAFIANKYRSPILCTPFTAEIIKAITKDEKIKLKNEIKILNTNSTYQISKNIKIEFVNMTHSIPQTVMVAIHTKYGIIIYANDFKFDNHPMIGKKPDYAKLKELGNKGVLCLIVDSTRANKAIKTPSEMVAKEMLRDVMLGVDSKGKAVIVTTFSSHIARLKSIVEFGRKMQRKIVFLGRSLAKYVEAAENIDLVQFSKEVEIVKFGKKIKKKLQEIMAKGKDKYLLVVTGHQGERKATLSKMVAQDLPFKFDPEDHIIFSCTTIPSDTNIKNRERLEKELEGYNVRIFKDIHTSGHASREDLRDLINSVKPKHIIPAHGEKEMKESLAGLCIEKGYLLNKTTHILENGEKIKIQ